MVFKFDSELITGIDDIDTQHEILFATIHSLANPSLGADEIISILIELRNYATEHFLTEQNYMQKFEYPNYEEHKVSHEKFAEQYNNLLLELADGMPVDTMKYSLSELLNHWLTTHYKDNDVKMAEFLRERLGFLSESL
jgi:hemerythrin-like metal-binding protein